MPEEASGRASWSRPLLMKRGGDYIRKEPNGRQVSFWADYSSGCHTDWLCAPDQKHFIYGLRSGISKRKSGGYVSFRGCYGHQQWLWMWLQSGWSCWQYAILYLTVSYHWISRGFFICMHSFSFWDGKKRIIEASMTLANNERRTLTHDKVRAP